VNGIHNSVTPVLPMNLFVRSSENRWSECLSKYCSRCFSIGVAVVCLGLVVTYKSVVQLLFQAAAACLLLVAVLL